MQNSDFQHREVQLVTPMSGVTEFERGYLRDKFVVVNTVVAGATRFILGVLDDADDADQYVKQEGECFVLTPQQIG